MPVQTAKVTNRRPLKYASLEALLADVEQAVGEDS